MIKKHHPIAVQVTAYARLHMGFFDLNGQIGRRFGSLGLSLDSPTTIINIHKDIYKAKEISKAKAEASGDAITHIKQILLNHLGKQEDVVIECIQQMPRHAGLGSGTQLALAIGAGLCALYDVKLTIPEIAVLLGRGLRSGIGIGTFEHGGLVLDGGRGSLKSSTPPIIARHHFPSEWPILLILDHHQVGLHGAAEIKAFSDLKDQSLIATEKLAHQLLLQGLPALVERNLSQFGDVVSALQAYTGDYFSPAQGGRYASPRVSQVLEYLHAKGVHCVGQTSWGMTGFAIFEDLQLLHHYLSDIKDRFSDLNLEWQICHAQNSGAEVKIRTSP